MFFGSGPNCLKIKKNNGGSITFFLQLQIEKKIPPSKVVYFSTFLKKIQKLIHVFDDVRA
jgi:hypothetical protein